ncbi:MAG: hypothetical protein PHW04_04785 [Candidatus Wallbacteria bacterium]|nr:hypothetical protein [Candidatus Wallbacteria bacterium]
MKKTFDAVEWMRKRREEIDREDSGLTWAEKCRKTREILESDPGFKDIINHLESKKPIRAA